MLRNKKTAVQIVNRLLTLCTYFNTLNRNSCNDSNDSLVERFGYTNRKQLKRDLDRLEDMGYIYQKIKIATPSKVSSGTATQYVRKYRTIFFRHSDTGLLALPRKTKVGDVIGMGIFKGQDVIYEKEDYKSNSLWILGPDHSLVKNPNYA